MNKFYVIFKFIIIELIACVGGMISGYSIIRLSNFFSYNFLLLISIGIVFILLYVIGHAMKIISFKNLKKSFISIGILAIALLSFYLSTNLSILIISSIIFSYF